MTTLLEELTELDRKFSAGQLSEHGYRRAKEHLLEHSAGTSFLGEAPTRRRDKTVTTAPQRKTEKGRTSAGGAIGRRREQVRARGSGAGIMAFALLILGIAFCEVLAQTLNNGLPYHRIEGQLVLLPGAAYHLYQGLQTGGLTEPQLVLAGLLTACYLLIPFAAGRTLRRGGGIFSGFGIALAYTVGAGVVTYFYLTVFAAYNLEIWDQIGIPALIGAAVLGAYFSFLLLIRRLLS